MIAVDEKHDHIQTYGMANNFFDWGDFRGDARSSDGDSFADSDAIVAPRVPPNALETLLVDHEWDDVLVLLAEAEDGPAAVRGSRFAHSLHTAVSNTAPEKIVRAILAADASGPSISNEDGDLPLHTSVAAVQKDGTGSDTVHLLLKTYPDAASTANHDGELPLHTACIEEHPHDVVRSLLAAHPDGAASRDDYGNLPLHWAVSDPRRGVSETVGLLLESYPAGARSQNNDGFLPIHKACVHGAPVEVLRALLQEHPKGISMSCADGNLPLHLLAGRTDADKESVDVIISAHPDGAVAKNVYGESPLHVACCADGGAAADAVRLILRGCSTAASVAAAGGSLPLHLACTYDAPACTVRDLLAVTPGGASAVDGAGRTPLCCAVRNNARVDVVRELLSGAVPAELASVPSRTGELPLHVACKLRATVEVVKELLKAYPGGVDVVNQDGNLPVHVAVLSKAPRDTIDELLLASPKSAKTLSGDGVRLSELLRKLEEEERLRERRSALDVAEDSMLVPTGLMKEFKVGKGDKDPTTKVKFMSV